MKTSYITNLLLLVLVIGLIWFTQFHEEGISPETRLSSITADSIQQIIIRKTNNEIVLQKSEEAWHLTHPFSALANPTRIKLLLSILSSPVHAQLHPQHPSALAQFGLDSPEIALSLDQHTVLFGQTDPLNQNRYVMFNDTIYLVDDTVMPILRAGAESYIENRLFSPSSQIVKLELPLLDEHHQLTAQLVTIEKMDGVWRCDEGDLTTDTLINIVEHWQHAQALQVKHLQQSESQSSSVRVWLDDAAEPMLLGIQPDEHNLLLVTQNLLYSLPKSAQSQLFPLIEE